MKSLMLSLILVVVSLASSAQCPSSGCYRKPTGYIEMEYSRSAKSENVYGLEAGLNVANSNFYVGLSGRTFTAHREKDNTTQALIGPRVGYAIDLSDKVALTPFAGVTYNYGGNENLRTSEWGPETGARLSLMIGRGGYVFIKPSVVFTSNQLYTLGIGFGGLF